MSNPTNGVWAFDGDATDWTITGPERYDAGLWLEEGTTNLVTNPSVESNATNWNTAGSGVTQSRVSSEQYDGTYSMEYVCNGSASAQGLAAGTSAGLGGTTQRTYTGSIYRRGSGTFEIWARAGYTDVSTTDGTHSDSVVDTSWARAKSLSVTTNPVKTLDYLQVHFRTKTAQAVTINADAVQIEEKTYATSYTAGTRAASSASIDPTGILDPATGSLAFRFTRKIDTGGTETILECGTAGSGTDYLSIAVNSSDKLVVSWNSDNAGAQTVTSTDSIAVDTEYFVYTDWNSTDINLRVDAATDTDTRDAVQDDFGAGDLTLEASAGGAIFNGFAAYDRPLTDYEQSRLYAQPVWGVQTLVRSNKFNTFQLRPIGA